MAFIRAIRSHAHFVAALALASAATPAVARGQSPEAVLQRVSAQAGEAARGVNNYTVELGFQEGVTLYAERRSPLDPFLVQYGAQGRLGPFVTLLAFAEAVLLAVREPEAATARRKLLSYGGVTGTSGAPAHVVKANFPTRDARTGGTRARNVAVHYDTATLLPRRMELFTVTGTDTTTHTVDYSDYRPVNGLQIPFQRRVVMRGVRAGTDTARARTMVNVLRAGLRREAPAERERTTQIITQLEGVLERDEMVSEVTVTSVRVNQGPPGGVRLEPLDP